jgi:hypothetical protein
VGLPHFHVPAENGAGGRVGELGEQGHSGWWLRLKFSKSRFDQAVGLLEESCVLCVPPLPTCPAEAGFLDRSDDLSGGDRDIAPFFSPALERGGISGTA